MWLKKIALLLTVVAVFSLMLYRINCGLKLFDIFILMAGIFVFLIGDSRKASKEIWPKISGYVWLLLLLLLFIIIGQLTGRANEPNGIFSPDALINYARVVFNGMIFLFLAFVVFTDEKSLKYLSMAAFISPVVILPVYWNYAQGLSGSRLTGYVMTPIILGMGLAVIYLVGLGLFLSAKKMWQKLFIFSWLIIIASFLLWAASRASWLGTIVALTVWLGFLLNNKKYTAIKLLASVVCISFFLGYIILPHSKGLMMQQWVGMRMITTITNPLKGQAQTQSWQQTANTILANPLGVGFNHRSPSNSILLEIGLDGGIGALTVALLFFGKILLVIKNSLKHFAEDAALIDGRIDMLKTSWLLATIALLVAVFFTDGFLLRHIWVVLGISMGVALLAGKQRSYGKSLAT